MGRSEVTRPFVGQHRWVRRDEKDLRSTLSKSRSLSSLKSAASNVPKRKAMSRTMSFISSSANQPLESVSTSNRRPFTVAQRSEREIAKSPVLADRTYSDLVEVSRRSPSVNELDGYQLEHFQVHFCLINQVYRTSSFVELLSCKLYDISLLSTTPTA